MRPDVAPECNALAHDLAEQPARAWRRIVPSFALWIGGAVVGEWLGWPWKLPLIVLIGFGPMHDLLIHGHEAVHRLISKNELVNEAALWALHAPFGVSGTAHRAFHLAHHRWTHEPRDPEWRVIRALGGVGWSYFLLPAVAPVSVILYALTEGPRAWRARVVIELLAMCALHLALLATAGPVLWATWLLAPLMTGLGLAFVLRSIYEHHATVSGDAWRNARTLDGGPVKRLLWSNIDLHLEHHLFPRVPIRHLGALRILLRREYERRGIRPRRGYLRTALRLYPIARHFAEPEPLKPS